MAFEREVWQAFITNNSGDIQPNAQITVFDAGTSNLSTIYSDLTGAPRSNPFNIGSDGLAKFYAEPARYRVQAQSDAGIAVFDDVDLSQRSLRDDLAKVDSEVSIAGFPARNFNDKITELQAGFDGFILDSQQDVDAFINENQTSINRLNAEQKLKDNAVVYLDFANNEGKEASDFTINRASATDLISYTAPDGVSAQTADGRAVFAPANTAAIGWNNGECVGLVSAPSSTNLLLWSEDFTQGAWVKTNADIEQSSVASPVGVNYQKIVANTADTTSGVTASAQIESGIATTSFFARAAGIITRLLVVINGTDQRILVDLLSGDVINNTPNAAGSSSAKYGERYVVTVPVLSGATGVRLFIKTTSDSSTGTGSPSQVGDFLYIIGAQLEQGYPTPYIKTEGSQVTRGNVVTQKIKDNLPLQKICMYWEGSPYSADYTNPRFTPLVSLSSGSNFGALCLNFDRFEDRVDARIYTDEGSVISRASIGFLEPGEALRALAVFDGEGIILFANGVKFERVNLTESINSYLTNNQILIGSGLRSLGDQGYSRIDTAKTIVAPYNLTNAEAIALTTLEDSQ